MQIGKRTAKRMAHEAIAKIIEERLVEETFADAIPEEWDDDDVELITQAAQKILDSHVAASQKYP